MPLTRHDRWKCNRCPAEEITFAGNRPKGWIAMNGEGLPAPIVLCPQCVEKVLPTLGVERLE